MEPELLSGVAEVKHSIERIRLVNPRGGAYHYFRVADHYRPRMRRSRTALLLVARVSGTESTSWAETQFSTCYLAGHWENGLHPRGCVFKPPNAYLEQSLLVSPSQGQRQHT
jgi:hypothetical protein